jgi:exonuclease III
MRLRTVTWNVNSLRVRLPVASDRAPVVADFSLPG